MLRMGIEAVAASAHSHRTLIRLQILDRRPGSVQLNLFHHSLGLTPGAYPKVGVLMAKHSCFVNTQTLCIFLSSEDRLFLTAAI